MSTIRGITVQIGADTTALTAALRDVNDASYKIGKELKDIEKMLKFNPGDTELLAQKQKLLGDQVATTSEKLNRLREVQEQVNEQFQKGEMPEEQHRAFQREIVKTESQLKNYEKQLRAVNLENNEFKQSMDRLGKSLDEAGKKMASVGSDLTKKLTVPLAGIGAIATKIGMDFESAMSKVQASSGASAKEMELLEKAARDAGASTSKSATDAADALGYMSLAGWDTKTSIEGLMPVLRLSEAGNIDLARASSLVTDSMSAMGIQVQDLEGYLDVVAQTARNSNTNIDQMAEAYIKVGGTLRGLNVPIEESSVALGMMANAGIKGSEAGAGLNAILLNLTAPAGRAKEALDGLGYSAFDAEGNFKGLDQVLFDLKALTADMSEEQRNLTLAMIGGKNHTKDLNALLNGLDDSYGDLKQAVMGADGALNDMADTMLDNTKGSLVQLQSALEELALKIYDVIQPAIKGLVDAIRGFVGWLDQLNPAVQRTVIVIAGIAAAIGPVLIIFGKLATGVGAVVTAFGALSAFITAKLIPAIMAINWPVVAVVAGIAALAAIAYEVYNAWDEVKSALSATWEYLKAQAENLGISISIAMEKMNLATIKAVDGMLDKLSVLEKLPFGVGESFKGLRDGVSSNVDASTKKLAELEKASVENAKRIAEATDGMKVSWGDVGAKVAEDVQAVIRAITGQTEAYAEELGEQTDIIIEETEAQTAQVRRTQQAQTTIVAEQAEERTEIISEEAEKQTEEREKFEAQWNRKLFELTASRLDLLEAEMAEALAKAEELEADKTAIIEYYTILRKQIEDKANEERLAQEEAINQKRQAFEERWNERYFELTADRLEVLKKEKEQALAEAEELGASTVAIRQYYALLERQILEEQAEEERRKNEQTAAERLAFEQQWADKLFDLRASELDRLDKLEREALEQAEKYEADKTAIVEYFALRREEIREREAENERKRQEQAQQELERFENQWKERLFRATADELELLEYERDQAIALAEELGADRAAILEFYTLKEQEILRRRAQEAEEEANRQKAELERQGEAVASFEERWTQKVFEQTASRIDRLRWEREQALAEAEKLGADKTAILEYYAAEERRIMDETEAERNRLAQQWRDRLFKATADELEILEAQMQAELELAEQHQLDITDIVAYYEHKRKEIIDRRQAEADAEARKREEQVEAEARKIAQQAEQLAEKRAQFEESWNRKLLELSGDRIAILEYEKEQALAQAEELGANRAAIEEYYNKVIAAVRDEEAQAEQKRQEALNEERATFEEEWNKKLLELSGDRLAILEYEKQQALAKAEALGADTTAILKYYAQKQAELADKSKQGWIKAAEDIGKAFETMALSVGKMFVTGTGRWEEILLTFVSSAIDHILVAAVGAMGIAELVSQAIANMWNPIGWVIIGGLLAALAVIQSNLQAKLGKVGGAVPPGSGGGGAGSGGGGAGSGGTAPKPAGGRQVAEITGPTRDLFMDLLAPLANLSQIVAPLQDIRSILDARLPNFDNLNMDFAGAGVGAMGGNIVFESGAILINSGATSAAELSRDMLDAIEREMARRVNFGIRGRGGK